MESWRTVWRKGFVPILPRDGLESLRDALKNDDSRLIQGATCRPPPLFCVQDWPLEATCVLGWCAWQGGNGKAKCVADAEKFFTTKCFEADRVIGEPAACRWFLNWYDDTPRGEMRRELLAEVELALA